ncbi:MAG: hypothetical protein BJ554DRAFT_1866 [Olpidium bornovanus]|uniref:Uncharacterized protein n=1 Tax=Olpidium bornovanus TaxID=278681 RepID=A0A8H8DH38_9FUNG|nr:MAG: hypothetical protein BJ554DRAFT_1866 [Olpidium bornovanus]
MANPPPSLSVPSHNIEQYVETYELSWRDWLRFLGNAHTPALPHPVQSSSCQNPPPRPKHCADSPVVGCRDRDLEACEGLTRRTALSQVRAVTTTAPSQVILFPQISAATHSENACAALFQALPLSPRRLLPPTRTMDATSLDQDAAERRRQQANRVSAKLGQKMLQGFTLMGDSCPANSCLGVPLVRDRALKYQCVNCQTEYFLDETGSFCAVQQHFDQPAAASAARPSATDADNQTESAGSASAPQSQGNAAATHPFAPAAASGTLRPRSSTDRPPDYSRLIHVLDRKVDWLREELNRTEDLARLRELCSTIDACVQSRGALL